MVLESMIAIHYQLFKIYSEPACILGDNDDQASWYGFPFFLRYKHTQQK